METQDMRPRGAGELLDVAVKLFVANMRSFAGTAFVLTSPLLILGGIALAAELTHRGATGSLGNMIAAFPDIVFDDDFDWDWTNSIGAWFAIVLLWHLVLAAATRTIGDAYFEFETTTKAALGFAAQRLPALLLHCAISGLVVGIGLLMCVLPGIYLLVAFAPALPIMLLEDVNPFKALGRARSLVAPRWTTIFWNMCIGLLLPITIILTLSIGVSMTFGLVGLRQDVADGIAVIIGLVGALVSIPFVAALVFVIYLDLRVRREGLDVQIALRDLDAPVNQSPVRPPPVLGGTHSRSQASPSQASPSQAPPSQTPPTPGWAAVPQAPAPMTQATHASPAPKAPDTRPPPPWQQ